MYGLFTLEITSLGEILPLSSPISPFWGGIFPAVGENITSSWDAPTNEQIAQKIQNVFQSTPNSQFTITLSNHILHCTANRYLPDRAFLHFKQLESNNSRQQIEKSFPEGIELPLLGNLNKEYTILYTLVDALPFPVFIKDANGRKILYNRLYAKLLIQLGNEKDALGKTDLELFKDNPAHIGYEQDSRVLTKGELVVDEHETFYTNENKRLEVLTTKLLILY